MTKKEKEKESEQIALEPIYIEDKERPKTLNKEYFLKDDPKNKKNNFDMDRIALDIMNLESIIEKERKELFEHKDYLASLGFILTDKSSERMAKLIHYIKAKIFVLLEGPTGTSKTRTTLIAYKYIQYLKKLKHKKHHNEEEDEEEEKELLRFNLSAETKVDDLIAKYTGDPQSPAGLKIENGPFFKAFTEGYLLLLDEINLAPFSVLQCIIQALDSKILSLEIPGRPLQQYKMHPNFSLIATQNPNTGAFANKRQDLGIEFLSRFQKIYFPEFESKELEDIAIGLAKCNNYIKKIDNKEKDAEKENNINDEKKKIVKDIVAFHINWKLKNSSSDDVQCFTIREIEAVIKALADGKQIYNTLLTIYGARYKKDKKEELIKNFKNYDTLKTLKPEEMILPKEFHKCFKNKSLIEVVNAVDFSLENERNVIIVGKEESGITQIARWCAEYFYSKKNNGKKSNGAFYLCTKNIQCSDLIGVQKPSGKMNESNELLEWKKGFLC
jgi:midasin (ATPase involved in ribosome maturation)